MNTYQELLQADYSTLNQLCYANPTYNSICRTDTFWRDKVAFQLGATMINNKPPHMSWHDYYASQYKIITLVNEYQNPVAQIYTTGITSVGELVMAAIRMRGGIPDGNYAITIRIGPYIMHSSDVADAWYQRLDNLGVLGYLTKNDSLTGRWSHLNDRTSIWVSLNDARVEFFRLTLRTQSKARHSYIKLSSGKLLGSKIIHSE